MATDMKNNKDIEYVDFDTYEGVDYVLSLLGDNLNARLNSQGSTLLHIVCLFAEDPYLIKHLLNKGCDPNIKDYRGWDASIYTAFNKNVFSQPMILQFLRQYNNKQEKQ